MAKRSRERRVLAREPERAPARAYNVEQVLDMGNVTYFTFRGRAYGVPPLGWRAGQRLQALWTEAFAFGELTAETAPKYYALIAQLPALLWRHCYPVGFFRRRFRRFLRNPFQRATEGELVELAAFFLARRSSSTISLRSATMTTDPATSSTTSVTSPSASRAGSPRRASR